MMFYLLIVIGIVGPLIHLAIKKEFHSPHKILGTFLIYLIPTLIGVSGIYAFIGHAFLPDQTAAFIGWPAGSPFQFEVACANLAFGVLGILAIWIRGNFWTATIIGQSIFFLGAAFIHIRDIFLHQNYAPGNAGLILYLDMLVPIILLILLFAYQKTAMKKQIA